MPMVRTVVLGQLNLYEDSCARSRYQRQGQVITSPHVSFMDIQNNYTRWANTKYIGNKPNALHRCLPITEITNNAYMWKYLIKVNFFMQDIENSRQVSINIVHVYKLNQFVRKANDSTNYILIKIRYSRVSLHCKKWRMVYQSVAEYTKDIPYLALTRYQASFVNTFD